ncbi:hypothetical protein [Virgibacillus sp. 6R]|uniref:hypothetical protein n=2 Tax=Bacillaceae TaxID=186817 RepID=UPI0018DE0295|nr:hypothetical protein [Virgibacillus sp. 6R]MBS7428103.1 hypothetical protein [Virgibacillus sp. 19R1-5]
MDTYYRMQPLKAISLHQQLAPKPYADGIRYILQKLFTTGAHYNVNVGTTHFIFAYFGWLQLKLPEIS